MASIRRRFGQWHLSVRVRGRQYNRSLKSADEREARRLKAAVEETVNGLVRGWLVLPAGVDVVDFLLSGGRLQAPPPAEPPPPVTLGHVWAAYEAAQVGQKETNTLYTERIHRKRLSVLDEDAPVAALTPAALQRYLARRLSPAGGGVTAATVRKELDTLRAVLNRMHTLTGERPPDAKELFAGVEYPKAVGDPDHFLTWAEIEPRAAGPDDPLWDRLFLTGSEVDALLDWAAAAPCLQRVPFLLPLLVAAAHTGARLAELTRSRVEDWDLAGRSVALREKKRSRVGDTFRRVSVSVRLAAAMQTWLASPHPGGGLTFCARRDVRLTSSNCCKALAAFTRGSRWQVLRGFHVLRHSLASNLAAAGTDQRVVDEVMGHQTEAMRRRYRHFTPETRANALDALLNRRGTTSGH